MNCYVDIFAIRMIEMQEIERIGVSLDKELLSKFDELISI